MASIWRPGKGICIKKIGSQMYLFQFFHSVDLRRVLDSGPWTFDNHLLILYQLAPGEVLPLIPLYFVDLWVQVYDLPLGYISKSIRKHLRNFIGIFINFDVNKNSAI